MTSIKEIIYDIEVYPNYCCISYMIGNTVYSCDQLDLIKKMPFDDDKFLWIGFNNRKYDHPILKRLMEGYDNKKLYQFSKLIVSDERDEYCVNKNIVDLYEICPKASKCSLKEFGHRLKYKVLENLPYAFDSNLSDVEKKHVLKYNIHDVKITKLLWEKLKPEYKARQSLKLFFKNVVTEFGGAPNVAQKVILASLGKHKIGDNTLSLKKMDNLKLSKEMGALYTQAFEFDDYKRAEIPQFMYTLTKAGLKRSKKYNVNGCESVIAIGGFHGVQSPGVYHNVYDYDVTSYYPSIILKCGLGSPKFRQIYRTLYEKRVQLKRAKSPHANSLKLVLNSIYGKMKQVGEFSHPQICAPNIGLNICLLGQFYMIDLMEKLEANDILCANTDGLICKSKIPDAIIEEWETRTGFKLDFNQYETLLLKDVNSYHAIKPNGEVKSIGDFRMPCFTHNVRGAVIQKAAIAFLTKNIPVEEFIKTHEEFYDFCYFSKVQKDGKLLLDDEPLTDPRIRYYASTDGYSLSRITPKQTSRILKNTKITLMMNLQENSRDVKNINYAFYIDETERLIAHVIKEVKQ